MYLCVHVKEVLCYSEKKYHQRRCSPDMEGSREHTKYIVVEATRVCLGGWIWKEYPSILTFDLSQELIVIVITAWWLKK